LKASHNLVTKLSEVDTVVFKDKVHQSKEKKLGHASVEKHTI
jgi:hypothetical protein